MDNLSYIFGSYCRINGHKRKTGSRNTIRRSIKKIMKRCPYGIKLLFWLIIILLAIGISVLGVMLLYSLNLYNNDALILTSGIICISMGTILFICSIGCSVNKIDSSHILSLWSTAMVKKEEIKIEETNPPEPDSILVEIEDSN